MKKMDGERIYSSKCKLFAKIPKRVLYRISGTLTRDNRDKLIQIYKNISGDVSYRTIENEVNRYGRNIRICKNSIKVLILLYFYAAQTNGYKNKKTEGLINGIAVNTFIETLQISKKNLYYSLDILQKYNFIKYQKSCYGSPNHITVLLTDYTMNDTSIKGGRGYIDMDRDTLNYILSCNSVNSLRIYIRLLIKQEESINVENYYINYEEFKLILPGYMRRKDILDAVDHLPEKPNCYHMNHFEVRLKDHDIKWRIQKAIDNGAYMLNEYVASLNLSIRKNNIACSCSGGSLVPELLLDDDTTWSLARNVANFGLDVVKAAIVQYHKVYSSGRKISIAAGAIIQKIIYNILQQWDI